VAQRKLVARDVEREKRSSLRTIRVFCLLCCCGEGQVKDCEPIEACPLWPWRLGMNPGTAQKRGLPVTIPRGSEGAHGGNLRRRAIRQFCLNCEDGTSAGVEACCSPYCPLWPWRFGVSPAVARARGKLVDIERHVPQDHQPDNYLDDPRTKECYDL